MEAVPVTEAVTPETVEEESDIDIEVADGSVADEDVIETEAEGSTLIVEEAFAIGRSDETG